MGFTGTTQPVPEEILFCGWRRDMQDTIMALDELVAPGSVLHILCDREQECVCNRVTAGLTRITTVLARTPHQPHQRGI